MSAIINEAPATLTEIVAKEVDLRKQLETLRQAFAKAETDLLKQIAEVERQRTMAGRGVALHLVRVGESLLQLRGDPLKVVTPLRETEVHPSQSRRLAIEDAIHNLAVHGGKYLRNHYIGIKNYQGCGDQRSDCNYGYGPRHGSIVLSIELRVRDRDLTPEEIEACIYTLEQFKAGNLTPAKA